MTFEPMQGHIWRVVLLVVRVGMSVETLPALVLVVSWMLVGNGLVGSKVWIVPGVPRSSLFVLPMDRPAVLLVGHITLERIPSPVSRPLPVPPVTVASVAVVTPLLLLVMIVGPLALVRRWRGLESVKRIGVRGRFLSFVCSSVACGRAPHEASVLRIVLKGKLQFSFLRWQESPGAWEKWPVRVARLRIVRRILEAG